VGAAVVIVLIEHMIWHGQCVNWCGSVFNLRQRPGPSLSGCGQWVAIYVKGSKFNVQGGRDWPSSL